MENSEQKNDGQELYTSGIQKMSSQPNFSLRTLAQYVTEIVWSFF